MPLFPAAVPRCRLSDQACAANFRLRILYPRSFLSFSYCSSARGVKGSSVRLSLPLSAPSPPSIGFLIPPAAASHRTFCSSAIMASKIDGTAIAKSIREGLKADIEKTQAANPRFKPNLVIFQGKHDSKSSNGEKITTRETNINSAIQSATGRTPVSSFYEQCLALC